MKKIVFTLQIFALVAAFPLYVISELNHKPTALPLAETSSKVVALPRPTVAKISTATTVDFDSRCHFFINN